MFVAAHDTNSRVLSTQSGFYSFMWNSKEAWSNLLAGILVNIFCIPLYSDSRMILFSMRTDRSFNFQLLLLSRIDR